MTVSELSLKSFVLRLIFRFLYILLMKLLVFGVPGKLLLMSNRMTGACNAFSLRRNSSYEHSNHAVTVPLSSVTLPPKFDSSYQTVS
jgi:hypothetical protein